MALPNHGDINWDVVLNAAINAKLDASGLDTATSGLVGTPSSALYQAIYSTFARRFPTYPTQAAAMTGLSNGEFVDGDIVVVGP